MHFKCRQDQVIQHVYILIIILTRLAIGIEYLVFYSKNIFILFEKKNILKDVCTYLSSYIFKRKIYKYDEQLD